MISEIITGEKIQQNCDLYIGKLSDFHYNPIIGNQVSKHLSIDLINNEFDNPMCIFCYSHIINDLSSKIHFFKNKFILISHNSDGNIEPNNYVKCILNCNNLVKWYAQNLIFEHNKLNLLPIGIANSMWNHGNLSIFNDINLINNLHKKSKLIYFNFSINTNIHKRKPCYETLRDNISPVQNLYRLKEYQFCICPEGNGVDTHRLWECLYLKVVPIVINTPFTQILKKYNIPLVILNEWNDLLLTNLEYEKFNFNDIVFQSLINFTSLNIYTLNHN